MSYHDCTSVSLACPVTATTYGYFPNFAGNLVLLTVFTSCCIAQLGLGLYYRAWSFMLALVIGTGMELIGYIGRLQMHSNPWNSAAFQQQIVCLILAPSFLAGGVYLSLKHIILYQGPEYSRLSPRLYTWIFIGCDILSIITQAIGGGLAGAGGHTNARLLDIGNDLMIAGISMQILTMATCGLLAVDFALRYFRFHPPSCPNFESNGKTSKTHTRFTVFCGVEVICFTAILVRCIYRLPEMAGGWGNPLMQAEGEFLAMDGAMIALASILFTLFHPGFWFPSMISSRALSQRDF